jgi:hypothetical protein
MSKFKPGIELLPMEMRLAKEMLRNREAAFAWDFTYLGSINPEVAPPQMIRTIPHVP